MILFSRHIRKSQSPGFDTHPVPKVRVLKVMGLQREAATG